MNRVLLFILLLFPISAQGAVLWQTAFNDLPDWGLTYLPQSFGDPRFCNLENPNSYQCTTYGPPPNGFYSWYMNRTDQTLTGNGIKIDNLNDRQGNGKAFTVYDRHYQSWSTGGQLNFHLPDYDGYGEIYVRYWMRYQPGYHYGTVHVRGSTLQKTSHISHYTHNGLPHMYFSSGGNFPTEYQQIDRDTPADAAMVTRFRGSIGNYGFTQPNNTVLLGVALPDGVRSFFDLDSDALPAGNKAGTGTDFADSYANGQWHCFEFYLKNNSAPGVPDGVYKFFFDGKLLAHKETVVYRDSISPLGEKVWNMVAIGGNTDFSIAVGQPELEFWRAYDDVVVYTPMTGAEPECGGSCVDGRLPLAYSPSGATTVVPDPEPTAPVPPRIRNNATRAHVR